jgi:hypothetical protein
LPLAHPNAGTKADSTPEPEVLVGATEAFLSKSYDHVT